MDRRRQEHQQAAEKLQAGHQVMFEEVKRKHCRQSKEIYRELSAEYKTKANTLSESMAAKYREVRLQTEKLWEAELEKKGDEILELESEYRQLEKKYEDLLRKDDRAERKKRRQPEIRRTKRAQGQPACQSGSR